MVGNLITTCGGLVLMFGKTNSVSGLKKKKKVEHFLIPYTKTTSKWTGDLNIRLDTTKFLEENIDRALFDKNCSKFSIHLLE